MKYTILNINKYPEYADVAATWFASKFGIDKSEYEKSINDYVTKNESLPKWFIAADDKKEIIAGCGLILNDFVDRVDLFPYICALFVEEKSRGNAIGSHLLYHARCEAGKEGFNKVYLCTDHTSFYEKYDWKHIGTGTHPWGNTSRIYECDTIKESEIKCLLK